MFPNVPERPGLPCAGEDRNMYRRGARRWRKLYRVNGHLYQAKRFSRVGIFVIVLFNRAFFNVQSVNSKISSDLI